MAHTQDTPNNQAGAGSRGEPARERPAADRERDAAGERSAAEHTFAGAGTGADVSDLLTATDGSDAGDPDPGSLSR